MAAQFNEGQTVRLITPVIQGDVEDVQFSKANGELEYLVSFVDEEGEAQTRWFPESKLEAVE